MAEGGQTVLTVTAPLWWLTRSVLVEGETGCTMRLLSSSGHAEWSVFVSWCDCCCGGVGREEEWTMEGGRGDLACITLSSIATTIAIRSEGRLTLCIKKR